MRRSIAIVQIRPFLYGLVPIGGALALASLLLGLNGTAGIGRNRLAVALGLTGVAMTIHIAFIMLLSGGARIRGYRNELRIYHATPSRSRPMVEVLKGDRDDIRMSVTPDLGAVRPRLPPHSFGVLPKLPPSDSLEFTIRGPAEEACVEVPAQLIHWNFHEQFERWKEELGGPASIVLETNERTYSDRRMDRWTVRQWQDSWVCGRFSDRMADDGLRFRW